jgi:hypothetical protein
MLQYLRALREQLPKIQFLFSLTRLVENLTDLIEWMPALQTFLGG